MATDPPHHGSSQDSDAGSSPRTPSAEHHRSSRGHEDTRLQLVSNKRRRRDGDNSTKPKRERCANACNRCKTKKLKCLVAEDDSASCSACAKAKAHCVFDEVNQKQAKLHNYVLALETRVATLERSLHDLEPSHPALADRFSEPTTEVETSTRKPTPNVPSVPLPIAGSSRDTDTGMRRIVMGAIHHDRPHFRPTDLAAIIQPGSPTTHTGTVNVNPKLPPAPVANEVLSVVYRHVQSRYPFLERGRLFAWHDRRDEVCFTWTEPTGSSSRTDDQIGAFFLWMIYAVGVELAPDPALESGKTYLTRAMRYLEPVLRANDITTVRAMLLLLFFSFRSSDGPPLWSLSGFAMRLCLELYLHRENHAQTPFEAEDRKRVFWSSYNFDRLIALASGRPFSIADIDIEIAIPVDIDVEDRDPTRIAVLQVAQPTMPPPYAVTGEMTNMSSAVHTIWHYRLRSRVYALYAVRAEPPSPELIPTLLNDLQEWRTAIPHATSPDMPVQPEDKFDMIYFQTVLFTLRQQVIQCDASDPLLALCAMTAAESCERGRKVHQDPKTKRTICSLCHIFVSGMTLLHCLSANPNAIPTRTSSRALRACSATLAIYAHLFPDAGPFAQLFEYFSDEVMDGDVGSLGGVCGDGKGTGTPTAEIIKQAMLGEFSQLGTVYESLNRPSQQDDHARSPSVRKPAAPLFNLLAPLPPSDGTPALPAIAPTLDLSTALPSTTTALPQLNYDLGNLNRYGGDLVSFLDISLDTPIDGWLGSWDQAGNV